MLERLKDKEMSCAGTTLGPVPHMMRYLKLMLAGIAGMKDPFACAIRRPASLLHHGKLDPIKKLANFEGPILTVGSEPRYKLTKTMNW